MRADSSLSLSWPASLRKTRSSPARDIHHVTGNSRQGRSTCHHVVDTGCKLGQQRTMVEATGQHGETLPCHQFETVTVEQIENITMAQLSEPSLGVGTINQGAKVADRARVAVIFAHQKARISIRKHARGKLHRTFPNLFRSVK